MNRKFKVGDLVTCDFSEEIEQPMKIDGYNLWYDGKINIYYVKGKHRRKGNQLIIQLEEGVLKKYNQGE